MSNAAVLLCGHGSRDIEAIHEFEALATSMRAHLPGRVVDHGFLEFARPTIGDVLEKLRASGAREVHALPGMLFAAGHAKNDIPSVLNNFTAKHPEITIRYGRELAIDPLMLKVARERIEIAERMASSRIGRAESLLLVVGRGTTDPDANSNVAKVARLLTEGLGYGWGEIAFSGVAHPRTDAAIERALRLGFKRIVVFPYFLFTGVLVKRIYEAADEAMRAQSAVEIVKAPYLNDHPLVIQAFHDRLDEITQGANLMNCALCKYRVQIIGYEDDLGAPQAGHHHHVEGIGTNADHPHDHDHHHHDHHHAPHSAPQKTHRRGK
ncbi:MAG: sirohydrochlorin chelatase [Alphaproteobacteria bacterium]|nr:sirohydrochlorin chelatase [Alphaproteobacteria bacterium]